MNTKAFLFCISLVFVFLEMHSQDAKPQIFEKAFSGDTSLVDPLLPYNFSVQNIGKIKIRSGKLISCDVQMADKGMIYSENLPKGRFLVQVAVAKELDSSFVAYCRICFSKNKVVEWKKATLKIHSLDSLLADSLLKECSLKEGAGIGILIDSSSATSINIKEYEELFIRERKSASNMFGKVYKSRNHSIALFYGNIASCYPVYIGYDSMGKVCRLLADSESIGLPFSYY